ncbi:hypothetical protein HUU42_00755 [bacterium]|nr:hypothetical protein [bacterium]
MKTFISITILTCLLATTNLYAQFSKGTFLVSGSASYKQSESVPEAAAVLFGTPIYTEGLKFTTFTILPRVGYFVNSKTAIGLGLGYKQTSFEEKDDSEKLKIEFPRLVIEPYVRFYRPLTEHAFFFFDGAIHFETGTNVNKYTDADFPEDNEKIEVEISQWGLIARPGFTYKFTDRLALELSIGKVEYSSLDAKPKGAPSSASITNTNFEIDFSLKNVSLGIEWYLSKDSNKD